MTNLTPTSFGPDNPREWSMAHPSLRSPAPHEPPAVLRLQRCGYRGRPLMDALRLKGTQVAELLQSALKAEDRAHRDRRPIHDGRADGKR